MSDTYFSIYQLYTPEDANLILCSTMGADWKRGKARTAELTDRVKSNAELQTKDGSEAQKYLQAHQQAIHMHKPILVDHMLKHVSIPKFNKYAEPGGTYKRHVDSTHMRGIRTDLACTTFLSDPDSYEGGELNIEDWNGNVHSYKGQPGECVVYPCGQPHWVSPVTKGERISIICWIQSHFRNETTRRVLSSFAKQLETLEQLALEDDGELYTAWTDLGATYSHLVKTLIDD